MERAIHMINHKGLKNHIPYLCQLHDDVTRGIQSSETGRFSHAETGFITTRKQASRINDQGFQIAHQGSRPFHKLDFQPDTSYQDVHDMSEPAVEEEDYFWRHRTKDN